jgi:phospholipase/lecithinase/hemolysin
LAGELLTPAEILAAAGNLPAIGVAYTTRLADVLANAITADALNRDAQRIVVITAPDITRTPRFLAVLAGVEAAVNGQGGDGAAAAAQIKGLVNQWTVAFNTQLKARFSGHSRVAVVDFYAEFNKWLDTPVLYGLTNTTTPACPAIGVDGQGLPTYDIANCTAAYLSANPPVGETGPNWWTSYVFSDNFHGTPRTNELMGNLVVQALEAKGWK